MIRRAKAVARWADVAAGKFDDDDTRAWLADVAKKLLVANDETDTNDFRRAVANAVGFTGQGGGSLYPAIRVLAEEIKDTDKLREFVRLMRNDLTQRRISDRALDLQLKRALAVNNDAADK